MRKPPQRIVDWMPRVLARLAGGIGPRPAMIHQIGTRLRIGKARRDAPLANKVKRVTALNVWNSSTRAKNRMRRCAGSAPRSMAISCRCETRSDPRRLLFDMRLGVLAEEAKD